MLQIKNISKKYVTGDYTQVALNDVSLNLRNSEFVAILGPSGSGKTTLLNIIGGLDRYSSGDLIINGISTKKYTDRDWDSYRNHTIGFVFQNYNLIPHQSILANVELALTISGISKSERRKRAKEALEEVGLGEQLHKKPSQMSGGQMQRVAIARALVNNPDILLADEPTGALDSETSVQVMELIQKISKNRLVVMVTHNPELAEQYANRIIKLCDGKIESDTNPYEVNEKDIKPPEHKNMGKSSMSFLTSLALSFNNLKTKKARTLLTSFAGSIGIIGIALILALSNGIQVYIDSIQRNTLTSYPITLETSTMDITSAMSGMVSSEEEKGPQKDPGKIYSNNSMASMIESFSSGVWQNDLTSFNKFLNSKNCKIKDYATSIQYTYNNIMNIYAIKEDGSYNQVSPSPITSMIEGMNVGGITLDSSILSSYDKIINPWQELMDNEELVREQYKLIDGSWPEKFNEVILIVDKNHEANDFVLQALGMTSTSEMMQALMAIQGNGSFETKSSSFTYDEIFDLEYKLVYEPEYYVYDRETNTWADKRDDKNHMKSLIETAVDIKIVGIVEPTDNALSAGATGGIGYLPSLTKHIITQTNNSEIVKQQLANPEVDVFTGLSFKTGKPVEEIKTIITNTSTGFVKPTISSMNKTSVPTIASLSTASATAPSNTIDFGNLPSVTEEELYAMVDEKFSEEESTKVKEIVQIMLKTTYTRTDKQTLAAYFNEILEGQEIEGVGEISGEQAVNYLQLMDKPTKLKMLAAMISNVSSGELEDIPNVNEETSTGKPSEQEKPNKPNKPTGTTDSSNGSSEQENETTSPEKDETSSESEQENVGEIDTSKPSLYAKSYEESLAMLGVVDVNTPKTINIYASDFEAKEKISEIINEYNDGLKKTGKEDSVIKYTDYIGLMLSSVTTIVNVISYVLIAFVAVSLIVSSIMIGIITYISVLERTKEIGILRAIGASKRNISQVFNAETFIVGLCSGLIGIGFSALFIIPCNMIIHHVTGNEAMNAILPVNGALILIGLSMVLTVIAGLIPSQKAAKKDPVIALRTE